eukprot:6522861-Pyramimonas_sp.AAC.1
MLRRSVSRFDFGIQSSYKGIRHTMESRLPQGCRHLADAAPRGRRDRPTPSSTGRVTKYFSGH